MPSFDRLTAAGDIRAVFGARTVVHGSAMAVHVRRRGDTDPARATVVVSRKVGGAVQRNRARRRLRAALTLIDLPAGADIIVVGRSAALTMDFDELQGQMGSLIARLEKQPEAGAR
jgi:ribonuclease P protein component